MAPTPPPQNPGGTSFTFDPAEAAAEYKKYQASQATDTKVAYVWLPGKKRKVSRNLREGRNGEFYGHGMPSTEDKEFFGSDAGNGMERLFGQMVEDETGRVSADSVVNWMYDKKKSTEIFNRLVKMGFDVKNWGEAFEIWKQAVNHASDAYMSSNQRMKMSPWDMIEMMKPSKEEIAARVPSPWRGLQYNQTSTQVDMADVSPETAKAMITQTLTQALGRGPSDQEIADFTARAAAIIHENPLTTQHTASYEWDPNATPQGGDYVQTGAVNQQIGPSGEEVGQMLQGAAQEMADANPEAGAYEAATEGMNAFFQAIQSPV